MTTKCIIDKLRKMGLEETDTKAMKWITFDQNYEIYINSREYSASGFSSNGMTIVGPVSIPSTRRRPRRRTYWFSYKDGIKAVRELIQQSIDP